MPSSTNPTWEDSPSVATPITAAALEAIETALDNSVDLTLVNAKGDLLVGTAADTVARVAVGSNDTALLADSAQTPGVAWGTVIRPTIADAKGDLIAATGADAVSRLAVGTNDHVLTADSAQSTGMKWAAVTSVPPGAISMYGAASAPTGWLLCNGSAVSRSTYATLFGIISTTYGVGDGSTTFNVPDMIGRVPVGVSTSGPSLINALGDNDGVSTNSRNISHKHTVQILTTGGVASTGAQGNGQTPYTTTSTTGDTNNVDYPAFLVVQFIIKT